MSLVRRPGSDIWYMQLTNPKNGGRFRRSCRTSDRKAAQELHDKTKAEMWEQDYLKRKPVYNWDQAVEQWLKEKIQKSSINDDIAKLRWLHPYLAGKKLQDITRQMIQEVADIKKNESSPSTANRHLGLIRSILRRAMNEWEWIDKVPKVAFYREASRRIRWLTREEAARLINELPHYQAQPARFALATGLRQRNVLLLEWNQIDMERQIAWVHPDQAKAKKAIPVPLSSDAMAVLREQIGAHQVLVFTNSSGEKMRWIDFAQWSKALERAGITDFKWHDLRHTWASWHVQAGTPLHVLQELAGWESPAMVRRYAHLSADHLRSHIEATKIDTEMCTVL
ncbi:MAG: site-specific integrase [Magnetococcales bacterium]|nr:site-specific integrase [Magnetococcales bacterium]